MPTQVNTNYSANFQKFVDFANKAYATKGENTVARFEGMPRGDYKGAFASFWRTSDMKTANDQVRDLFLKTVANMFGGEKFIPDIVRDNMKLEDFGKGKPLTARRINLVRTAIDMLGGGKFTDAASVERAKSMGYAPAELPKLARVANIYQQATGCTNEEAEEAALDTNSKARVLFDCGGRFTLNVDSFKKGLALMDKFAGWYGNLQDDYAAGKRDTTTKLNLNAGICNRSAEKAVAKFLLDEIAVNPNLPLDAENPEDAFGMANNPAMRFVGRNYTMSFANSLAQIPPEKRSVLYAVFDAFDKIPTNAEELANRKDIAQGTLLAARVIKNFDAVVALKAEGKLDRANLVPLLYPDFNLPPAADNAQINDAYDEKMLEHPTIIMQVHMVAANTGVSIDDAADAVINNRRIANLPWISPYSGSLECLDGTAAGGRKTMLGDLHRPTTPTLAESKELAIPFENAKFVFNFPGGEKLVAETGADNSPKVRDANNAIADKLAELCGRAHPKQLANVYYALSQSSIGGNTRGGLAQYGIVSDEHIAVTFTISRNDDTGAVTIRYSEPKGLPVKFSWTTTIDVDGNSVTTPMRVDHGQYEAEAMKHVDEIARKAPGKDKSATEKLVKEMLAYCGDDFDLKDVVSRRIANICITATSQMRSPEQIKGKIDAIADNFKELRKLSKNSPDVYEAGKRMMVALDGKALPPGIIAKLVLEASNAKIDAIRKLSPRSSALEIHHAISQFSENIVTAMNLSEAEAKTDGANEKQACRNFIAGVMIGRCGGANALRAMQGAFAGDKPGKMLSLYESVVNSQQNEGVEQRLVIPFENLASNHMMNIANLKGAIDVALDGDFGEDIVPFNGEFNADEINAAEILDDLLNLASR
ncbi:MAG: hypothetical protein II840_09380 [Kiritimatiellae bacterium]|nr:hypothetical protein [Kiritimatiellia bacterium]